jgi:hypothetical protein
MKINPWNGRALWRIARRAFWPGILDATGMYYWIAAVNILDMKMLSDLEPFQSWSFIPQAVRAMLAPEIGIAIRSMKYLISQIIVFEYELENMLGINHPAKPQEIITGEAYPGRPRWLTFEDLIPPENKLDPEMSMLSSIDSDLQSLIAILIGRYGYYG